MDFTTFIVSLTIGALGFLWWLHTQNSRRYYKNIPAPPTVPIFGNALDLRSTSIILDSLLKYTREHGGLVKVKIGPTRNCLLVTDCKMLEFILSSITLLKKPETYRFLYPWLGNGLLTVSGPRWKKHRKILTPAFHYEILQNFVATFESCGEILIQKLSQEIGEKSVDIYPFITLCTLDVICESTMGISIKAQDDVNSKYVHCVKEMCRIIIERSISPVQMYNMLYRWTKNYRIQKQAIGILHEKAKSVILQRRKELEERNKDNYSANKKKAFLDLLLEATIDGQPLTDTDIREEVDTFMFAGHDTTASAISFALFCLANHPTVQQSVFEEQQLIFEYETEPVVTYSHLQSMKYLEQVIKETLRLYPPVPILGREFEEDVQYANTLIPKGDTILMFSFGVHRNPEYFENPNLFDPGRFQNVDSKFPYTYIPFSTGPRNCIGQKFAMLEMKSILSKIIRKFELRSAVPQHNLKLIAETVLKSGNGIKISLRRRT